MTTSVRMALIQMERTSDSPGSRGSLLRQAVLLGIGMLAGAASGCGDGRPDRIDVSGQVLIDGEPLTYGVVRFVPRGGRPAVGRLNEEGRFTLSSYGQNDGVVPGTHRVEVNAAEWLSGTERKWHAPPKYFRYTQSGLTQEVVESTDSVRIELTWDGGEPYIEKVR